MDSPDPVCTIQFPLPYIFRLLFPRRRFHGISWIAFHLWQEVTSPILCIFDLLGLPHFPPLSLQGKPGGPGLKGEKVSIWIKAEPWVFSRFRENISRKHLEEKLQKYLREDESDSCLSPKSWWELELPLWKRSFCWKEVQPFMEQIPGIQPKIFVDTI